MFLGKYSIRPLFIIFLLLCAVFFERCAEPENEQKNDNPSYTSTLSSESIGNGSTGSIEKYFYNFARRKRKRVFYKEFREGF